MSTPSVTRSLDPVFRPRTVAVVGASRTPGAIGYQIVRNLIAGGFQGAVYPVNPSAHVVCSVPAYPSISDIPEQVDLVVLVIPAKYVLKAAREAARCGVGGLVVISAGFRETDDEGRERESKLLSIAQRSGMRLVGPNCMGVLNTEVGVSMNASFAETSPIRGKVAFVSQSGALGEAILAHAKQIGLGLHMFASVGNRADIGAHDLLEYWADDPCVSVILLYLESFGDAARFKAVADRLRGRKPIIAVKSGRSAAGARAAGSHTGSVAGEDRVVDTFLSSCGVLRANNLRQMFTFAQAVLEQPKPHGPRVGLVTNAGGPGILATDALDGCGMEIAELSPKTLRNLAALLPPEATASNPVDLIATADADRYRSVLRLVGADEGVDSLIALFVSPIRIDAAEVARAIVSESQRAKKPIVACIMGKKGEREAKGILREAGIPVFVFPEEAVQTLAGLTRQTELSHRPKGRQRKLTIDNDAAKRCFKRARRRSHDGWLRASDARELLTIYGLPLSETRKAATPGAALIAARDIGYPICLKAAASGLVHKSDLGGVATNLTDGDSVFESAERMFRKLGRQFPDMHVEVQAMARGHRELLIGMTRQPPFGALIVVGMGGTAVEVLRDTSVRISPLLSSDAATMLSELRGAPLLDAFRGDPAVDHKAVEDAILRIDRLTSDFPQILELDVNPFIVGTRKIGSAIVDVRIRVEPGKKPLQNA